MTKGGILFGLAVGGTIGLFVPRIFGFNGFSIANIITALIFAVLGLIGVGVYVHWYGRIR